MGILGGLLRTVTAPVEISARTINSLLNEEWELEDVGTFGLAKVVKATMKTARNIVDEFD